MFSGKKGKSWEKGKGILRRVVANAGYSSPPSKSHSSLKALGWFMPRGKQRYLGRRWSPDPASRPPAGKETLKPACTCRRVSGGWRQVTGCHSRKVNMPYARNKAGSLPNPALWLQRLGEAACSEQHLVQGGGKFDAASSTL